MTEVDPESRVLRNEERHRYELWVGDDLAGYSDYRDVDDDGTRQTVFTHTEIDDAFGGRGLGSRLVEATLDDVVRRERQIVPICPFVQKVLRDTSTYDEYVRWPAESGDE